MEGTTCPRCATPNPTGARFCLKCGSALIVPSPSPSVSSGPQQFAAAMPAWTVAPPARKPFPWVIGILLLLAMMFGGVVIGGGIILLRQSSASGGLVVPGTPAPQNPTPGAQPTAQAAVPNAPQPTQAATASTPVAAQPTPVPAATTVARPTQAPVPDRATPASAAQPPAKPAIPTPAQAAPAEPTAPIAAAPTKASGVGGLSPAPIQPTKPALPVTIAYQDPGGGFYITYPEGWHVERNYASNVTVFFKDNTEGTLFGVIPGNIIGGVMEPEQLILSIAEANRRQYPDFELVSKSVQTIPTSGPSMPGYTVQSPTKSTFTAGWTNPYGVKIKGTMNLTSQSSQMLGQTMLRAYFYQAPVTTFTELMPIFSAMESSMR